MSEPMKLLIGVGAVGLLILGVNLIEWFFYKFVY
jgi:hypothetical protein